MYCDGGDNACLCLSPLRPRVKMTYVPFEEVMPLLALMLCLKRKCKKDWNLIRDSRKQKPLKTLEHKIIVNVHVLHCTDALPPFIISAEQVIV
jgi:hypothetical protein